jgi:1-acyl-sn-glycerol-3-phosphate acyltransferase
MKQIEKGENVVFFANHQSEADPQVMSILLEKAGYGVEAEEVVYVAGHKVTTDTLAIPFSMGRNLICIHSKKHIDSDPETKPIKQKQNLAAMNGMLRMQKEGGTMIWVAPSGGRDRRDLSTGKVPIAPFDQKTVDMFRLMGNKSKVPTHYYALSMVTYDLCPPPDFVEAGTGEQRNVRFVPCAIKISPELENVGGVESRHLFTEYAFQTAQEGYEECLKALGMED